MPHEAGAFVAINGQVALVSNNDVNRGFYTNPTIEHFYYSFSSNGIQSISFFAEHIDESRNRFGLWSNYSAFGNPHSLFGNIDEQLQLTTLGLETSRTLISESDFRFGAGLGIGIGLGGASADVRDTSGITAHFSAATAWEALLLEFMVQIKYGIGTIGRYEIALHAEGRYWGFPAMGPIGSGGEAYNGPGLRVLSEMGYLAGISVGF